MRRSSVRGMRFSVVKIGLVRKLKKNRHRWRFFWNLLGSRCCYVNLPLLHRRWAGMAKPKIKGKENGVAHGEFRSSRLTITTLLRRWQDFIWPVFCRLRLPIQAIGCVNQTPSSALPAHLRDVSCLFSRDAKVATGPGGMHTGSTFLTALEAGHD